MWLFKKKYSEKIKDVLFEEKNINYIYRRSEYWHQIEKNLDVSVSEPSKIAKYLWEWEDNKAKAIIATKNDKLLGFYILQKIEDFWYIDFITYKSEILDDLLENAKHFWETELKREGSMLYAFMPHAKILSKDSKLVFDSKQFTKHNFIETKPVKTKTMVSVEFRRMVFYPKVILFVCIRNTARSQMAEAFFNFYNKDQKYFAMSAGTNPDRKISNNAVKVMKEKGIDISCQKPKRLTKQMAENAFKIFTMGCMDQCSILPKEKTVALSFDDPYGKSIEKYCEIQNNIETEVKKIIKELPQ